MTSPYSDRNDPAFDAIPLPVDTASVDLVVGGFPGEKFADLVIGAANSISSASYTFVAGDVGKIVVIMSGTNFTADTYYIASVAGGEATLNASPGTQGATAGVGYLATDCRALLILGAGNVALTTQARSTQKETLTAVPVGTLPIRPAKVYKAANGTTATNVYGLF